MRSEDIAKLAGVSRSTVSRVINNYSNVPEETRTKVLKVIEQHQYEPNSFARALAGKKTHGFLRCLGKQHFGSARRSNCEKLVSENWGSRRSD